jgi:hypothetical protein
MKMTPTAVMQVILGLTPLHVTTEVMANTWYYRIMCTQQWKSKSINFGHTKILGKWSMNPSYRCGQTGCY